MEVHVDPELSSILTLGVLTMDDVTVVEHDAKLDGPLADAERQARHPHAERGDEVSTALHILHYRSIYN